MDKAVDNAREAIDLWCEAVIEDGGDVPLAKTLTEHRADPDVTGWIWAVVEVPVERYFGPSEKLNITLPRLLRANIDDYARSYGKSRSGFLAEAARLAMR